MWLAPDTSSAALSRIQLDHQAFVDRGRQIGTCRKRLERALHFLCIDLDPFREAARFGRSDRALDAQLLAEIGQSAAAVLAVLSRRIAAALDRAFVGEAFLALEEELLPLAAALAAFGIEISGHAYSSICAAFSAACSRCGARASHPQCC